MKKALLLGLIIFQGIQCLAQAGTKAGKKSPKPVKINWVSNLSGDFSFTDQWSYPLGVEVKSDGRAGCADGGFCPERCYSMLDSNGIVLRDSVAIFYQLLDTTHMYHTIACEAACYEWDGTNFINVERKRNNTVYCQTLTGISTHSSLKLEIRKDSCFATIHLNSIMPGASMTFYCLKGYIHIDKELWEKGIMKAEFNFDFKNPKNPREPIFWKGRIYTKIKTSKS